MKKNPVYVISVDGEPLMPTFRYGKVRNMLKNKEAKIIKRDPFFTIQLLKVSNTFVQPLKAGMDIGDTIGLSVINKNNSEILSAELKTRSKSIPEKLKSRSDYRRTRRGRLRHRKERFNNRKSFKGSCKVCGNNTKSGQMLCSVCLDNVDNKHQNYKDINKVYNEKRLAPSVKHIVNTHFKIKDEISSILPLNNKDWIIEKTKFDIQKMKNIDISGDAYQKGDLFGFTNIREFVLYRDDHTCQNPNCKHKKKNKDFNYIENNIKLHVHHLIYRSKGGTDKVSNLITLCTDCHTSENHQKGGILWEWCINHKKVNTNYSSATKMNVVASAFNDNNDVSFTIGSETKRKRQIIGLDKTHANDAFAICIDKNNFEIIETDKKRLQLKENIKFDKIIEPLILIQTNGKESGRRKLESFHDAVYIDVRTNEKSKGKQLEKETKKRTVTNNKRIYRGQKVKKGKTVYNTKRSKFTSKSIVQFDFNNSKIYLECGGMSGNNLYVNNFIKKTLAFKKYNAQLICNKKGIIKKNIKN